MSQDRLTASLQQDFLKELNAILNDDNKMVQVFNDENHKAIFHFAHRGMYPNFQNMTELNEALQNAINKVDNYRLVIDFESHKQTLTIAGMSGADLNALSPSDIVKYAVASKAALANVCGDKANALRDEFLAKASIVFKYQAIKNKLKESIKANEEKKVFIERIETILNKAKAVEQSAPVPFEELERVLGLADELLNDNFDDTNLLLDPLITKLNNYNNQFFVLSKLSGIGRTIQHELEAIGAELENVIKLKREEAYQEAKRELETLLSVSIEGVNELIERENQDKVARRNGGGALVQHHIPKSVNQQRLEDLKALDKLRQNLINEIESLHDSSSIPVETLTEALKAGQEAIVLARLDVLGLNPTKINRETYEQEVDKQLQPAAIKKCQDAANKISKHSKGKIAGGILLALAGIALVAVSVAVAASTFGASTPLSIAGCVAGVALVSAGIGIAVGTVGLGMGGSLLFVGVKQHQAKKTLDQMKDHVERIQIGPKKS